MKQHVKLFLIREEKSSKVVQLKSELIFSAEEGKKELQTRYPNAKVSYLPMKKISMSSFKA